MRPCACVMLSRNQAISRAALFSPMQRSPVDRALGRWSLDHSPAYLLAEGMSRMFSPYQLNPMGVNPLRSVLEAQVDFDNVNKCRKIAVHVTATNVRTGRARVFSRGAVSLDAVMASACLPQMYPAVQIGDEHYWDGGFSANPALMPLVTSKESPDIVIIQINPIIRHEIPVSAREIINRTNELSFNTALIKELRSIAMMQRIIAERGIDLGAANQTYVHLIHTDEEVQDLEASSKLNAEWAYLQMLFGRGRSWADAWLSAHFDKIGKESSFDLADFFDDPAPGEKGCGR